MFKISGMKPGETVPVPAGTDTPPAVFAADQVCAGGTFRLSPRLLPEDPTPAG